MAKNISRTTSLSKIKSYDIFDKKDAAKLGEKLWDEIIKSVPKCSPDQLIPVVNEVFHQNYPNDSDIVFLSTEYPALHKEKHASIFNDITFQINHDKIYHLESQMKNESDIVIRMIEYDFSIALQHGTNSKSSALTTANSTVPPPEGFDLQIHFPASAVIYPAATDTLPSVLSCDLVFPDGSHYSYQIPTIRIQDYTLAELHKKHLNLFIPYTLLRFRSRLESTRNPLTKNELTEFLNTLILDLEEEVATGTLTTAQYRDYLYLIIRASERIFAKYDTFRKEVSDMTECKLILPSEKYERIVNAFHEEIDHLNSTLKKKESLLKKKDSALKEKDSALKEKDALIQSLKTQLEEARRQ